ncbi:excalibur calcium-binding domain-containing protein [Sulfitobacter albidus]|uniref:Excalibur calcium-binding domain-containing protein n=1 Tax=Sulfitobacter albidus TaxID=2829501 RepID=A0A975PMT3_9RHOB|nr:excalibur calcium-binding domain-containing protein [Sulfitobacter albidus]QUJ77029.1 excalibur calcium-binding domain-containing protein [Sulfitobacter albidus]
MKLRFLTGLCAVAALAACQPSQPDDTRFGVGFDQTFDAQRVNRETALTNGTRVPAAPGVSAQPLPPAGSAEATAAQTTAVLAQTSPNAAATAANSGVPPLQASPSNPAPAVVDGATGISRENNFDAVSNQRSIESDAARIAAARAQYQVIQPQALPERTDAGPNIVAYALQTSHPVGTQIYKRFSFNAAGKYNRNCGQFRSQDRAQILFLESGGPEKDPKGMDPDGDGYACTWDPSIYRNVSG